MTSNLNGERIYSGDCSMGKGLYKRELNKELGKMKAGNFDPVAELVVRH